MGTPEVLVDGAPLVVDTRKAIAILAVLATDGRAYAREELAALLWPDSDDRAARGALRRTLSTLRAALHDDALLIDRTRVALAREAVRIDLAELGRLGASTVATDLAAAADLARGPFLAGFSLRDSPDFDDWRAARSVAVERAVADVLDRLIGALEAAGDLAAAAATAGRRIDLDPLDEGAHVRRMELLAAIGDRAAALRQYRACVAVLERELGVAPLAETTARYEAIRDAPPAVVPAVVPAAAAAKRAPMPPPDRGMPERIRALPLVGRDAALETIEAARRSATRDGRVVAIIGEAGIGKTRLTEAAADLARAGGATVVGARAYAAERSIAFGPVVAWLEAALADPVSADRLRGLSPGVAAEAARLVPALGGGAAAPDPADAAAAQARLLGALVEALTEAVAGPVPGLLVLDDVPWADSATLAVIAYLVRRLRKRRMTLLLCWRREDLDETSQPLVDLVEGEAAGSIVELERLDRASVEALVGASSGDPTSRATSAVSVDGLWRASEGLPLYVVEALASGSWTAGEMPSGVRAVLRGRLAPVGGLAQQVLAAAAAIGRSFDLATVRHASGRSEDETIDALEELTRRGLIREFQDPTGSAIRYDFAHAGLRDLAEELTSLARRRLLHRRIADALRLDLAGAGRDDLARLARIARHERDAGREAEAAEAFRDAGDGARRVFANHEAIAHYEAALALGHPAIADLHVAIGDLRTRLGDYGGAVRAYEAAAALVVPAGLPLVEAALARAHLRRGDLVAAARHLDAGLDAAPDAGLRARLFVDRAVVRRRAGDLAGAAVAAAEAVAAARDAGDTAALGAAQRIAGFVALDRGAIGDAQASLQHAMDATATDPDPSARVAAQTGLAIAAAAAGDLGTALAHGEAAAADCRRIGDRHLEAAVENHLADILHQAGREEEALDHLRRAVAAFAEVGGDPADPDPGIWMLSAS